MFYLLKGDVKLRTQGLGVTFWDWGVRVRFRVKLSDWRIKVENEHENWSYIWI